MSILYLHFNDSDRPARVAKLEKSGARVLVAEPNWPGFFEVAKKEKPYAIAIDFSRAPSHALYTADYLSKAKETRETPLYLLRVPHDKLEAVAKRLPQGHRITEHELSGRLAGIEKEAEMRARQKKEAAAEARRQARSKSARAAGSEKPPSLPPRPPAKPKKAAPRAAVRKGAPPKKKSAPRRPASRPAKKKKK